MGETIGSNGQHCRRGHPRGDPREGADQSLVLERLKRPLSASWEMQRRLIGASM
jgi:hypothetical protein